MKSPREYWRRYRRSRGWARELVTIALCLLVGLLLVPCGIFFIGGRILGPYANGGLPALIADIVRGLAAGSLPFWLLVAGPYIAVWMWRLLRWGWR
jgi:hypothetical protein